MRVRLTCQISGTRNGLSWPAPGAVVSLPDHEAESMISLGLAVPAPDEVETATMAPARVETAAAKTTGRRRRKAT